MRRVSGSRIAVVLAALAVAGCDGPPLGGEPSGTPPRAWFAGCPRLAGNYTLADPLNRGVFPGEHPWDELSIEAAGDDALRFTWRYADRPDPSVVLRMEPDQLTRYRWSIGEDERTDDDFVQSLFERRGLLGEVRTDIVQRKQMRCEHGWLAVPHVPGGPDWPPGFNRSAQFTIDRRGALVADFPVHVAEHGFFSPSSLWCGHACRDALNGGHDVHAWIRANRTLATRPASLEAAYDEGHDVMGSAAVASEAVRARWRERLRVAGVTLVQVRARERAVEITFAANDRQALVAATVAMRRTRGLHEVVVRRFSGGQASPQTLTVTANADPEFAATMR